ncbi:MAG TPA: phage holin family protein [Solirubrobacteraceae bacterium]|nr:phage holin family protein [Solirubrobacteraceae bacterium]
MSSPADPGRGRGGTPENIATALTDVSERAVTLIHEEIELAKTEFAEKTAELMRGAAVAAAAGVFVVMAVIIALIGGAWLLYFYLPGPTYAYFWGFFAMAAILLVIAVGAGMLAARIVKRSSPPVPAMAIDEAKKIRDTVSASAEGNGSGPPPSVSGATSAARVAAGSPSATGAGATGATATVPNPATAPEPPAGKAPEPEAGKAPEPGAGSAGAAGGDSS